jgi:iron(III) transport system substrate-binding protein
MMTIRCTCLAVLAAILVMPDETEARDSENRVPPLVVYAGHGAADGLEDLFEGFTAETGVPVRLIVGSDDAHAELLIASTDSPRADLFLSGNVQAIWRVAEEGALRPHGSDFVDIRVPPELRDADGFWTALWQSDARLFVDKRSLDDQAVAGFEYLADPAVAGRLCLTSSDNPLNRAVIARLIDHHGRREAEIIVRGWVRNFAQPPMNSEKELVAALAAGDCGIGIVSSLAGRPIVPGFVRQPLSAVTPVPRVANAATIGVSRHATAPERARKLIEWLLFDRAQTTHPESLGYRPVVESGPTGSDVPLGLAGRLDEEVRKLAERARYR